MFNKILYCVPFLCILVVSMMCMNTFAEDSIQVSVAGQRFDIEDFFYLKEKGFRKDKVDFNKGWLGIFMENAEGKGILVKEITMGSPADEAGLKTGDIITKINNETTINIDKDGLNLIKFKKTIETTGAGGVPGLTVSRNDTEMVIKPKLVAKLLTNTTEPVSSLTGLNEGSMSDSSQKPEKSFIDFAIQNETYKERLGMAIQRIGEEAYVREGFQTNNKVNTFRLSIVDYLMLHPFDTHQIGQNIHENLMDKDIGTQVEFAADLLDVKYPSKGKQIDAAGSLQEQLQLIIDSLVPCVSLIKGAFRDLSHEEVEFLYQNAQKVWLPDEKIMPQDLTRLLALSQNVDFPKLFEAVSILLNKLTLLNFEQRTDANTPQDVTQTKVLPFNLPEPIRCQNSQNNLCSNGKDTKDFAGDILFIQDTNIGKIVVGGTGTSYYYADAAVIIDLGGDDYYFNNAGASNKDIPVSICIDFSGNDVYNAANSFAQGTGRFGIGLLMDFDGNDKYLGQNFSQGSCLFGIGLLLDNNGDDFYSGHVLNQGVGFFGAGLLSDLKGNDVYFSGQFAQGVGFTKGVGALIDARGNDFYFAGGKYPDFRDPEKSFQSMSQGMGMGIRPEETIVGASGGVGVLIDQKGNDQYHGDYFSQGSGYYFSLGLLHDSEGADKYYAGRYAQGAGIHSAIGLLEDKSGDDTYECSFGVSQGCGHDTGIGFLVDYSGDDSYRSATSSQGIGLEKGMGILADFCGNDGYYANDNCQGFSSPSKTEDIVGIGMLLDNQGILDIFRDTLEENLLLYRANGGLILNK
ncbi:MAG: PDZ domain-containing protein [Candidatus Brocadiales bacterium]|nr:PDZ domain-containing protein [Candidatus Brocadiales bacterium]